MDIAVNNSDYLKQSTLNTHQNKKSIFDDFNNKRKQVIQPQNTITKDLYEKNTPEQKNTEKLNNWQKALVIAQCVLSGAFAVGIGLACLSYKNFGKYLKQIFEESSSEAKKNITSIYKDLTKEKTLEEMLLPQSLKSTTDEILNAIKNPVEVYNQGGELIPSILLYGPPGTGKTTYAHAIAKAIPKTKLVELDITNIQSEYHSLSEKNLKAMIDKICNDAKKMNKEYENELKKVIGEEAVQTGDINVINNAISKAKSEGKTIPTKERIIVFIDEIDSVMMVDPGLSKKISNDFINEFKRSFTDKLAKCDNIITIGATNLEVDAQKAAIDGKVLDKAVLSRFSKKVRVPNPDKVQIRETIKNYYKNKTLVDKSLKEDSEELEKLSEFLSTERYNVSFRTVLNILKTTGNKPNPSHKNKTIQDIVQTIKENKEELNLYEYDLKKLDKLFKTH